MPLLEHVPDQAITFADMQAAVFFGDDARSILSAMLQHGQRIVNPVIDRRLTNDTDDSAHTLSLQYLFGEIAIFEIASAEAGIVIDSLGDLFTD